MPCHSNLFFARTDDLALKLSSPSCFYSGDVLAEPYDWQYCRYLAQRHGVIGIPAAPFFSRDDYSSHYRVPSLARFAFCKRDETLIEATRRLRAAPQDYIAPSTTSN